MLRPFPNLDDAGAMQKLGRMSAIRSAWLDALHDLRDCVTRLNASNGGEIEAIEHARRCLDRMEKLLGLNPANEESA